MKLAEAYKGWNRRGFRLPKFGAGAAIESAPLPLAPTSKPKPESVSLSEGPLSNWRGPLDLLTRISVMDTSGDFQADTVSLMQAQQADGGWKANSEAEVSDHDSSVLNHITIATYLRRAEHAKSFRRVYTKAEHAQFTPDEKTVKSLRKALSKSWQNLNGSVPERNEDFLGALPESSGLKKASHEVERLHEALLGRSLAVRMEPKKSVTDAIEVLRSNVRGAELTPQPKKFGFLKKLAGVAAVGAGVALAASAGILAPLGAAALAAAPVVAGMAAGWATASYNESFIHDEILHIRDLPSTGKIVKEDQPKSWGRIFHDLSPKRIQKAIYDGWFGHTKVHHHLTYKDDQVTQFRDEAEEEKLNGYLVRQGQERLIDEEHGRTLNWDGYLRFQAVALPSYVAALGTAAVVGALAGAGLAAGGLFAAGFAGPAAIYPLFSKYYHRYTHMSSKEAVASAPQPISAFLKTDASRFILRHHLSHHYDESINFNLMPGGDWMRGKLQAPTVAHEEEMRRMEALW